MQDLTSGYRDRVSLADDGFTDWRGNTLKVGDRIIYTTRSGSHMNYVEATILEMDIVERGWRNLKEKRLKVKPYREGTHGYVHDVRRLPNRNVSLKYVTKVDS
jgi:hypothetical protein